MASRWLTVYGMVFFGGDYDRLITACFNGLAVAYSAVLFGGVFCKAATVALGLSV